MLVYPQEIYENETHVVQIFPDAHLLPYWRMGVTTTRDGKVGVNCRGEYRIVVAFAALRKPGPFDFVHRICYVNCGGAPYHLDGIDPDYESDNLLAPNSFVAGQALTTEPTKFGLNLGGPDGNALHFWRQRICERKNGCDAYCRRMGIRPLESSIEKFGLNYQELS
jgi:hypothetical protein